MKSTVSRPEVDRIEMPCEAQPTILASHLNFNFGSASTLLKSTIQREYNTRDSDDDVSKHVNIQTSSCKEDLYCVSNAKIDGVVYSPRWGHASTTFENRVYIFGGYIWHHGIEGFFNDLFVLDTDTNTMQCISYDYDYAPPPRFGHTMVTDYHRKAIMLCGGRNSSETFGDLWKYDIVENKWMEIRIRIDASSSTASTVSSGTWNSPKNATNSSRNDGYMASDPPKLLSGDVGGDNIIQSRSWHASVVYNNFMYIHGGWNEANIICHDIWALDLNTLEWSKIWEASKAQHFSSIMQRSCHCAAVWKDALYVFGGLAADNSLPDSMCRFSFKTYQWSDIYIKGLKPKGRTGAVGVVVDGKWIIHGGIDEYPNICSEAINDIIVFNFETNQWRRCPVIVSDRTSDSLARYGHVSAAIFGTKSVLLMGGATRYATITDNAILRVDLVPSYDRDNNMKSKWEETNERLDSISENIGTLATNCEQLRQAMSSLSHSVKVVIDDMQAKMETVENDSNEIEQTTSNLQHQVTSLQQSISSFECFIPMMRNFGAAIANFGNMAPAGIAASQQQSAAVLNSVAAQHSYQMTGKREDSIARHM